MIGNVERLPRSEMDGHWMLRLGITDGLLMTSEHKNWTDDQSEEEAHVVHTMH